MPAGGTGPGRNSTWGGPDLLLMGQPPGSSTLWRVRDGRYKDSNSYVYRFSGSANGRKGNVGRRFAGCRFRLDQFKRQ